MKPEAIIADTFNAWWRNEGSSMPPKAGEDAEEHVRRIAEIAWSNGAYIGRYELPPVGAAK